MGKIVHFAAGVKIPQLTYYAEPVDMVEWELRYDSWRRAHDRAQVAGDSADLPEKRTFLDALGGVEKYRSVHASAVESGPAAVWFTLENPLAELIARAKAGLHCTDTRLRVQPSKMEVELPWTRIESVTEVTDFPVAAPSNSRIASA